MSANNIKSCCQGWLFTIRCLATGGFLPSATTIKSLTELIKQINWINMDHYGKHVMVFISKTIDVGKTVSLWSHRDGLAYLSLTSLTVIFLITLLVKIQMASNGNN